MTHESATARHPQAPAAEATGLRYVLITPARNEAAFLERTIQSVIRQTVLPLKWVIVSDGSTDGTDEIVGRYAAEHKWIELLRVSGQAERHFGGKVRAFNAGYKRLAMLDYDIIANLDADITIDSEYFEFLLGKFAPDPQLGVAGTPFREGEFQYDYRFVSLEHVSGACQLFRRDCFEAIGGYKPIKKGIDLVAVTTARMKGWKTRCFTEKSSYHHRKQGTGTHHSVMVTYWSGYYDYVLGVHPLWQVVRSVYEMRQKPFVLGGCILLAGYLVALLTRVQRPVSQEFVCFRKREQMRRLKSLLLGFLGRNRLGAAQPGKWRPAGACRMHPSPKRTLADKARLRLVPHQPGDLIGTFMGRDAVALSASCLRLEPRDCVLLPAFVCGEVIKPFLKRTRVEFYDLQTDMTINPAEVRKRIAETSPKALLIVNYFGFLQPDRSEIRQLCRERGVILVEDCAHSLLTEGSGDTGDLALYSFRKLLPVPDGGALRIAGGAKPGAVVFYPRICSTGLSLLIVLKSLLRVRSEAFSRARISERGGEASPARSSGGQNQRLLPLSWFTERKLGRISTGDIIQKRRADYARWQELGKDFADCKPVRRELPDGVCPLAFPLQSPQRQLLKARLEREGVPIKSYWRLHRAVPDEFRNSHKLASEVFTLPIYPEARPCHFEKTLRVLAGQGPLPTGYQRLVVSR